KSSRSLLKSSPKAEALLSAWIDELTAVRVLDPACGSGNFLYLALRRMLDLWLEAQRFAAANDISMVLPKMVSPSQLYGIETEFYAHELASIVVWIGYLQWKHEHGIPDDREPILERLSNIEHADAILRYDDEGNAYEPGWPKANFIIGNPPFLGSAQMKRSLGDSYCDDLRSLYEGRVKGAADLVVYWFERARQQVEKMSTVRVGLLATQGIRGGANQETLKRIIETGVIFWAISDKNWTLDGATVHVSLIAFTGHTDDVAVLNGEVVPTIFADISGALDTTKIESLSENHGICFRGTEMHGAFDLSSDTARKMLAAPTNPNGKSNADVVKRYLNATDITNRDQHRYVIDFGTETSVSEAALYELPFEYIKKHVYPVRSLNRRESRKQRWWLHGEPNPGMRLAMRGLDRYAATPRVSKHRIFTWISSEKLPDSAMCVFARSDDYFMGLLHSCPHELWARKVGTQLREAESGFRYTPKTTFDTFPFPFAPGTEPAEADSPIVRTIAQAARELVRLRDAWLNPPNASEADLKDRTLTKLYNARPEWLANAHRTLDQAVLAAYGWPSDLTDQEILSRLLALNHERAAVQSQ
ncbi:MAG TPA: DNA methyltransferase, partial [Acidobacteriaceae bacterium]